MNPTIKTLLAQREKARLGGGEKRIAAQHAKKKLTYRIPFGRWLF
jgi:acetyl-CoA carboxylase carboxyltransferase component